jgi:hypothetical protein
MSGILQTIVPRKIIEELNLRYDDDYLEWRMEMRGDFVRKIREVSVLYFMANYT